MRERCAPCNAMRGFRRHRHVQRCMGGGDHAAEYLADGHIERAKQSDIGRARLVAHVDRGQLDRRRELPLRVPQCVRERRLLREQQQEYATELQQAAHDHGSTDGRYLPGDQDRVRKPVTRTHRDLHVRILSSGGIH